MNTFWVFNEEFFGFGFFGKTFEHIVILKMLTDYTQYVKKVTDIYYGKFQELLSLTSE